jgi:predicted PurR-regulated permease PerM
MEWWVGFLVFGVLLGVPLIALLKDAFEYRDDTSPPWDIPRPPERE